MYYFVVGQDGSRYGPADVDTLVQWAREGRLVANSQLIERGSERQLHAGDLPALSTILGSSAPSQPPQPGVRIERDGYPAQTYPGNRPYSLGAAPPNYQPMPLGYGPQPHLSHRSKVLAGVLGLLLGTFGVHRFYLGYTGIGMLQLILGICSCGISGIWGFIEGIIILTGGMQDVDGRDLRD